MGYTAGQTLRASQLSTVPCTSATRPSLPHEGQSIVESDTGMVAIYSGSAWRYLAPTGEVSTHAEYNVSGTQSIPNNADTVISWGTDSTTTALVTKATSGAGHQFTLNRSGIWSITYNIRMATGNGERSASINDGSGPVASSDIAYNGVTKLNVALTRYFGSGQVLTMIMYQSTGGAISTVSNFGDTRLHFAWIHS